MAARVTAEAAWQALHLYVKPQDMHEQDKQ
jgi:hypothetical protein